ncbi:MAG: tetratricopeptide repeat protein [Eubacterium sp.]|nr:tetratricopeptide repeat protein [Eubacterium sp.]
MTNFSTAVNLIQEYMREDSELPQIEFIANLFHKFYDENADFSFDAASVNRWINGAYAVSPKIRAFYAEKRNNEYLGTDFEEYVLPYIYDISMLADRLYSLVISDISISETKRNELTSDYPFDNNADISDFIGRIIAFTLERKFTPNTTAKIGTGTLSPITDDIIFGNEPPKPCKYFCGRDSELEELHRCTSENDKIFVTGIAGIGKSEFIKAYAKKYKKEYANILYFNYSKSIEKIIIDMDFADDIFSDSNEIRFKKHNRFLRSLKNDTLIIIDNFNIAAHNEPTLQILMKYNCKIIFTSRCTFEIGYTYELKEIASTEILFELFGKFYSDTENHKETVTNIIEAVHHHTMAVEMSARLIEKGIAEPEVILGKLTENGANPQSEDKIGINKDGINIKATYYNHVRTLFSLYLLDEENKYIMRCTVFVPNDGIRIKMLAKWAKLENTNVVNELIEVGFIQNNQLDIVVLHPMLRDISIADLQPDFDNCKRFIESVHNICLIVGTDVVFHNTVLAISENIMKYSVKNNTAEYLKFIEDAFNFMEKYRYESGMKAVVTEITNILKDTEIGTNSDRALKCNFQASYENEFTGNISKAIGYASRALSFCDTAENPVLAANLNMNLGNLYVRKNELDNAKKYMETAMEIMANANVPTADLIIMTRNYADLLYMLSEKIKALNALVKCAEFAKNVNHSEYAALIYDAAVINADLRNFEKSVQLFNHSFKAYAEMGAYEELQDKQLKAAEVLKRAGFSILS